jgi:uncharacterized protein YdhG (YjbR/CyaY superfamily)|nr:DUF1801 domain-containing protein [uncultured Flavobacterium sp.]
MTSNATTVEEYIASVPEERRPFIENIRKVIIENLPEGFEEGMSYGMIGYYVPHSIYPNGYHCNPKLPLPFMTFASQKNSINFYHMSMYMDKDLYDWFVAEYPTYSKQKLDMGKSCVRFKKLEEIPLELLGKLVKKVSVADWIAQYEKALKK